MWHCVQEMAAPATSERRSEKFVQWREPVQSRREEPNVQGDGTTSRGRPRKPKQRVPNEHVEAGASCLNTGLEDSTHVASAGESELRGPIASPGAGDVPSGISTPRFRPPGQHPNTRSKVRLPGGTVNEMGLEQPATVISDRIMRVPTTRDTTPQESTSFTVVGADTAARQKKAPAQGTADIRLISIIS